MTEATIDASSSTHAAFEPHTAWGAAPSDRYGELASRFRPLFARIRAIAVERDLTRRLPHDEIRWLREAGFIRVRLSREDGGAGATLPELIGLLIELAAADTNVVNAVRAHLGFVEDVLTAHEKEWRAHWLGVLRDGAMIGAGLSEAGNAKVGTFATQLTRTSDGLRLNGKKFYTTGSLFADWVAVAAQVGEDTVKTRIEHVNPYSAVLRAHVDSCG